MQHPMSEVAVLVIDMFNTYRHEDAELLAPNAADIIDPLSDLVSRARERDDVDPISMSSSPRRWTASVPT
jgi:nicotinamidase-related amidase